VTYNCVCGTRGHFTRKAWLWLIPSLDARESWDAGFASLELGVAECRAITACHFAVEHTWLYRDGWEWIRDDYVFVLFRWADEHGPPRAYRVRVDYSPTFDIGEPVTAADCHEAIGGA